MSDDNISLYVPDPISSGTSEKPPVIFLDIDGVLNNELEPKVKINPKCVENLNWLIDKTGAKVVISSTWRKFHMQTPKKAHEWLDPAGFKGEVIDKTPDFGSKNYSLRGNEIHAWLRENRGWDFAKYVILDDDSDMLYWQKDNYIWVDRYCGLTHNTAYKAAIILQEHGVKTK